MNINSRNINIIYLFLYFSLLVGFYFNEDFALGYKSDYLNYRNFVFLFFNRTFWVQISNYFSRFYGRLVGPLVFKKIDFFKK